MWSHTSSKFINCKVMNFHAYPLGIIVGYQYHTVGSFRSLSAGYIGKISR